MMRELRRTEPSSSSSSSSSVLPSLLCRLKRLLLGVEDSSTGTSSGTFKIVHIKYKLDLIQDLSQLVHLLSIYLDIHVHYTCLLLSTGGFTFSLQSRRFSVDT